MRTDKEAFEEMAWDNFAGTLIDEENYRYCPTMKTKEFWEELSEIGGECHLGFLNDINALPPTIKKAAIEFLPHFLEDITDFPEFKDAECLQVRDE